MSIFTRVPLAPADPILGITDQFNADTNPDKVNLGVGAYLDEDGNLPLMKAVHVAEERLVKAANPKRYLPIDGLAPYTEKVRELVFGKDSQAVADGRVFTAQSLSGTGALKLGADLVRAVTDTSTALISKPTWANHRAIFERAGYAVKRYSYYDADARGVDLDGMIADLEHAEPGTVVILHACCHNPTGYDLAGDQWDKVGTVCAEKELVPFLDMAYQGFSHGIEEDAHVVRDLVGKVPTLLVASSFSKNFGLYGERAGALSIVCDDADEVERVRSQLKIVIRTNYSNPPTHGAAIVDTILGDAELRVMWEDELAGMRERIRSVRHALATRLESLGLADMGFIETQVGMFSYSGLDKEQMRELRDVHSVYGTDSGRLCMAGVNSRNLEHVAQALAAVAQH